MSSRPRVYGKCKPPEEMARRCLTAGQKKARLRKLESMIATNQAAIRHAQARVLAHRTEIAILEAALIAMGAGQEEFKPLY